MSNARPYRPRNNAEDTELSKFLKALRGRNNTASKIRISKNSDMSEAEEYVVEHELIPNGEPPEDWTEPMSTAQLMTILDEEYPNDSWQSEPWAWKVLHAEEDKDPNNPEKPRGWIIDRRYNNGQAVETVVYEVTKMPMKRAPNHPTNPNEEYEAWWLAEHLKARYFRDGTIIGDNHLGITYSGALADPFNRFGILWYRHIWATCTYCNGIWHKDHPDAPPDYSPPGDVFEDICDYCIPMGRNTTGGESDAWFRDSDNGGRQRIPMSSSIYGSAHGLVYDNQNFALQEWIYYVAYHLQLPLYVINIVLNWDKGHTQSSNYPTINKASAFLFDADDLLLFSQYYGNIYNWWAIREDIDPNNPDPSWTQDQLDQATKSHDGSARTSHRGLSPSGWIVPTDEEWMELERALGMSESQLQEWHVGSQRGFNTRAGEHLCGLRRYVDDNDVSEHHPRWDPQASAPYNESIETGVGDHYGFQAYAFGNMENDRWGNRYENIGAMTHYYNVAYPGQRCRMGTLTPYGLAVNESPTQANPLWAWIPNQRNNYGDYQHGEYSVDGGIRHQLSYLIISRVIRPFSHTVVPFDNTGIGRALTEASMGTSIRCFKPVG